MKKISDATVMVSDSSGARPSSFIWYEYSKVKAMMSLENNYFPSLTLLSHSLFLYNVGVKIR